VVTSDTVRVTQIPPSILLRPELLVDRQSTRVCDCYDMERVRRAVCIKRDFAGLETFTLTDVCQPRALPRCDICATPLTRSRPALVHLASLYIVLQLQVSKPIDPFDESALICSLSKSIGQSPRAVVCDPYYRFRC
jgi:hypothetical protein